MSARLNTLEILHAAGPSLEIIMPSGAAIELELQTQSLEITHAAMQGPRGLDGARWEENQW
jgi:hypothetical protein